MKAIVTVLGKDMVGILAKVSSSLAECNANVIDVNQSVLEEYFAMMMVVNIDNINRDLSEIEEKMRKELPNMKIYVMHEDIFNSMHKI